MSAGNAAAALGLANTSKIAVIGAYVQDSGAADAASPGPEAELCYMGVNGNTAYNYNALGELVDPAFTVKANSGAATGKLAQWVTNTAEIAAGTTRLDVSATGVATANNSTGLFDLWVPTTAAIPANSYFWAFGR